MTTFLRKYSTPILVSLLVILLILARLFPSAGLRLGIIFLLCAFFIASAAVLEKHKQSYRSGKIERSLFIRNAALEITGTWLAMALAGLLGRMAALTATQQITHELTRLIAGISMGVLVGIAVGLLVRQTWSRFVKIASKN
jgi:hypothetical protein